MEEGHCLREHALAVCEMAGAHERVDFHATSMETLRQMVATNAGVTLMPVLAVKLQEMFGLAETPRLANGRVPVLIHLLSPAGRPLAVTSDLKSFWDTVYPEVQKEMKGRYPKHPWPDDPWNATATRKTKKAEKKF